MSEVEIKVLIVTSTQILVKDGNSETYFFIGASDQAAEGKWKTVESDDRCDVHLTNWNSGEPNDPDDRQDCAIMNKSNGKWHDYY